VKRLLLAAWNAVTQKTGSAVTRKSGSAAETRSPSKAVTAVMGGMIAAGLGLGALAVVVLCAWITSPFPDGGLGDALRTASDCWLLAHGADLVRMETLSGRPAPVGVTPLLLTALPVWLLHRAGSDAAADRAPLGWVITGYLTVAAGAVLPASYGPLRVDALSVLLHLPVVAAAAVGLGAWAQHGRPLARLRLPPQDASAALRGARAGVVVLVGGGAALAAGALLWRMAFDPAPVPPLAAGVSGRIAVFLTAVLLAPDAAVWGAAYALGPGFTVGSGAPMAPGAPVADHLLPNFPLLAALPPPGPGTRLSWAVIAVPVAAGLAAGWFTAGPRRTAARTAALTVVSALVCGVALAALAHLGSGPLGSGALARFGPTWWLTGAAAAAWTAMVGVPAALTFRALRTRPPSGPPVPPRPRPRPRPRAAVSATGTRPGPTAAAPGAGRRRLRGRPR
jgi:hypothetical protein